MIYCKELDKDFDTAEQMHKAIIDNLPKIVEAKKSILKMSDGYGTIVKVEGITKEVLKSLKNITIKAFNQIDKAVDYTKEADLPNIIVTVVSNTTNYFDSHYDVHLDNIWNKTISDNKNGFDHLQEHKNGFANVISENCKTKILRTTFKELGYDFEGKTQALQHTSIIDPIRNLFMYNQYANGWVNNHSVGMRYKGDIIYCANSEVDYMKEYKDNWDKYYSLIANKDEVDEVGRFWAVPEAKLMEFSAIPRGSNPITPTLNIETQADKSLENDDDQADKSLEIPEPPDGTQKEKRRRII